MQARSMSCAARSGAAVGAGVGAVVPEAGRKAIAKASPAIERLAPEVIARCDTGCFYEGRRRVRADVRCIDDVEYGRAAIGQRAFLTRRGTMRSEVVLRADHRVSRCRLNARLEREKCSDRDCRRDRYGDERPEDEAPKSRAARTDPIPNLGLQVGRQLERFGYGRGAQGIC